jgi:hypothetical protein
VANWQFITILCVIVGGFGIADLVVFILIGQLRRSIEEQIAIFKADLAAARNESRLARIEDDIRQLARENRELKQELRQVSRPVLPGSD